MSTTFERVRELVLSGRIKISDHGYDELAADGLLAGEVIDGFSEAIVVEEYPTFAKGPCVLVLQKDARQEAVHVLWGIPAGATEPAVLITAYRPDPSRWSSDFLRRKS